MKKNSPDVFELMLSTLVVLCVIRFFEFITENIILILCGGVLIGLGFFVKRREDKKKREKELEQQLIDTAEQIRLDACNEIVEKLLDNFGYFIRELISQKEIQAIIDSGVMAGTLRRNIIERIENARGITVGFQNLGGKQIPVLLLDQYRTRHQYIIGKSGYGKTNLIRSMLYQDFEAGEGVGVIAPEQEMITDEILPFIPESRIKDVIYMNPMDHEVPVGFNPLDLDSFEDIDLKADELTTIFLSAMGGESLGKRMEEILRQTFYTLLEAPETSLLDVSRFLDKKDDGFRRELLKEVCDENSKEFFENIYPGFPKDAALPIINRLGKLLRPKRVRNLLCVKDSLNFRAAMDESKILLFNLSDGVLGQQTAQVLGQIIVSKIQLTAMSRADIPPHERKRFYLYIDEFQSFVSTSSASYEKILSRARKYQLGLVLAHQQTGQIPPNLLNEILGNVTTIVSFTVSGKDATRLAKEFIKVDPQGQVLTLRPEELLSLNIGQSWCRIKQHSMFMPTYPVLKKPDYGIRSQVIEYSRKHYGSKVMQRRSDRLPPKTENSFQNSIELDHIVNFDPEELF